MSAPVMLREIDFITCALSEREEADNSLPLALEACVSSVSGGGIV